jgi:hypothetical protein
MKEYSEITSQFIQDRMKETTWEDHRYIGHLCWLADLIRRGAKSFASGMAYHALRTQYPVEAEALALEISEGKTMTPEEFRSRKEAREEKLKQEDEAWAEALLRAEASQKQEWLESGGLP